MKSEFNFINIVKICEHGGQLIKILFARPNFLVARGHRAVDLSESV